MAIAFTKYVDITSGVGGQSAFDERELIGLLFTNNPLVPTDGRLEFTELEEVGTFFGQASEEYKRAVKYFGFISKSITKADKIAYGYWSGSATAPLIYGAKKVFSVSDFTAIADGQLVLTIGTVTEELTGLNFTGAVSLNDVASTIETAVQAASADPFWATATVTYDAVRGSFNLTGGATGASPISTGEATGGTDIVETIGWQDTGILSPFAAIFSPGIDAQAPEEMLDISANANNNFGSFLFMPALTLSEVKSVAEWNDAQNVLFIYTVGVDLAVANTYASELSTIGGVGLTLTNGDYADMIPMIIFAATDYSRVNASQNYMYQVPDFPATVTDTTTSNSLDAINVNYMGAVQEAGSQVVFYQRGKLQGSLNDPRPMNVYANEIWLKNTIGVALLNLLLALPTLSANKQGRATALNIVTEGGINPALFNGVISPGKPLDTTQKAFVDTIAGESGAWQKVENQGFWLNGFIEKFNTDEYKFVYTLIYSKDDAVYKIEGSNVLI